MAGAYLIATLKIPKPGDGDLRPFVLKVGIYSEQNPTRHSGDTVFASLFSYHSRDMTFEECERSLRRTIDRLPEFAWVRTWIKKVPLTVDLRYTDPDRFDDIG